MSEAPREYRVLVTGSREWFDEKTIAHVLKHKAAQAQLMGRDMVVVHGACPGISTAPGADLIAHRWAKANPRIPGDIEGMFASINVRIEKHPADWATLGRKAGPLRNQKMVDLHAFVCVGFPMPSSVGTWDCVKRALANGIPVELYPWVSF